MSEISYMVKRTFLFGELCNNNYILAKSKLYALVISMWNNLVGNCLLKLHNNDTDEEFLQE